jgi:hypothetical protein
MNAQITTQTEAVKPGIYWNMVGVFRVQVSKTSGKLYAKQLDKSSGAWSYAPGVISKLQPQTRVTLELAQAYGLKTGNCLACGRKLTNQKSCAAGVGPVCAKMF